MLCPFFVFFHVAGLHLGWQAPLRAATNEPDVQAARRDAADEGANGAANGQLRDRAAEGQGAAFFLLSSFFFLRSFFLVPLSSS